MDDLSTIAADDQATAFMREQRKRAQAIAGDIGAYRGALQDVGFTGELLDDMTRDFGEKWHTYQLAEVDADLHVSVMYDPEGDDV